MTTRLLKSSENINGLPIGFQEVEYLESTGTQWIDTGINVDTSTDEIKLYFQLTDTALYKWFFGEYDTNARLGLGSGDGENKRNFLYQQSATKVSDTLMYNKQHLFEINSNGGFLDGTKIRDYVNFASTASIYLFNLNIDSPSDYRCKSKIWKYEHKRNGVLVRDFIPALNPAGRPCMYDLVGKKAYYNLGTGEFTYGRKIIPVEYLEAFSSTNVAYIPTKLKPTVNTNFETKVRYNTDSTTNTWALGATTWWGVHKLSSNGQIGITNSSGASSKAYANYTYNTDVTLKLDGSNVYVDGNLIGTITKTNATSTIDLFRYYNDSNLWWDGRIYYFKADENGVPVVDMIPCIDENNIPYMFDKVTHTCYLNAGTGTFNYGKKLYNSKIRLYKDSEANKLPAGFKRVEYLESTGTQFIDTGVEGKDGITAETRIQRTSTSTNECFVGAYNTVNRLWLAYTFGGQWYCGYNTAAGGWAPSTPITDWYILKSSIPSTGTVVFDCNGTSVSRAYTTGFNTGVNVQLFQMGNTGTSHYPAKGKMSYCKLYDYGVLVRNFIPALDTTNTPCMYDTVTQTPFYNQGSGEFTYGAIIPNKVRLPQSTEIRFPKGYTEVEYLESDSTAYIDTGVSGANDNLKIEMGFSYSKFTAYGYFFSNYESESANVTRFCLNGTDTNYGLAYINTKSQNGAIYTSNFSKNNFHTFILTKTSVSIDGNTTTNNNPPVGTANTKNIILFNRGSGSYTEKRDVGMRCYYFRIYDNNTLIRYFIPCLDPNGRPCLWDTVTKQPFYNQGTGEFTYGRSIQQVEYLESTGTQYINTGIKLNNNYSVELDYQLTQATQSRTGLFGALNMTGSNQGRIGSILSPSNQQLEHGYGAGNDYWQQGKPDTNRHILYQKQNETYFDGALIHTFDTATFSLDMSAYLGNFVFTNYTPAKAKYYSSRWWDGNILVRNYVPAIDSNNVGFMFDRVTHTIYDNAGTGSFTYGSPVPNKIRN